MPESEGIGRRKWHTRTEPRIEVVEVGKRTTLERLLGRNQPNEAIAGFSARRAATLETDADNLEKKVRRVDAV